MTLAEAAGRPQAGSHAAADFAPVIVCGVGRSGTSLLQSMLAAHPGLCLPPETQFFRAYVASRRRRRALERAGTEALVARLARDPRFARAGILPGELLQPWLQDKQRRLCLAAVYRRLLEEYARREGREGPPPVVGDKDPKNIEFLPALAAAYPHAYVLHIVRDPRAVLASRMDAEWSRDRPWWIHPLIQAVQWRRGRRLGARSFGERWLELRYEDLLTQPEAVLRRVCGHLGLEFDAAMLEFGTAARRLVAPTELSWKKDTLGPLQTRHADKWRQRLSVAQAAWAEACCHGLMREHGYVPGATAIRRGLLRLPAMAAAAGFRVLYAGALWSRR
jgi:hypothetical protein